MATAPLPRACCGANGDDSETKVSALAPQCESDARVSLTESATGRPANRRKKKIAYVQKYFDFSYQCIIWHRAGKLLGVQEHVPRNRNVLLDRNNRNTFLAFLKI